MPLWETGKNFYNIFDRRREISIGTMGTIENGKKSIITSMKVEKYISRGNTGAKGTIGLMGTIRTMGNKALLEVWKMGKLL